MMNADLVAALTALESAEYRCRTGERGHDLREAALKIRWTAQSTNDPARAAWWNEIAKRANHVIDACKK